MHAYLITGGTTELRFAEIQKRLTNAGVTIFDTVYLDPEPEEEHIGIDAVRAFKKRMLLSPQQSPYSAGVIRSADTMTTEAQNALLKVLEEPPPHAIIFCETDNQDLLLPTIVSRLEGVHLLQKNADTTACDSARDALIELLEAPIGQKLSRIEVLAKDRVLAKLWIGEAILAARHLMLENAKNKKSSAETKKITTLIRLMLAAQKELAVNVNPRLVLDTIFLSV